jgi:hypothetical protein
MYERFTWDNKEYRNTFQRLRDMQSIVGQRQDTLALARRPHSGRIYLDTLLHLPERPGMDLEHPPASMCMSVNAAKEGTSRLHPVSAP